MYVSRLLEQHSSSNKISSICSSNSSALQTASDHTIFGATQQPRFQSNRDRLINRRLSHDHDAASVADCTLTILHRLHSCIRDEYASTPRPRPPIASPLLTPSPYSKQTKPEPRGLLRPALHHRLPKLTGNKQRSLRRPVCCSNAEAAKFLISEVSPSITGSGCSHQAPSLHVSGILVFVVNLHVEKVG